MNKFIVFILFISSTCWGHDHFELLISKQQITQRIQEVAATINQEYADKEIVVVMVMKGAVCISSDLIQEIKVPCKIEYLKASSYGQKGTTGGELTIAGLDALNLTNKHLLLVDDIFDRGITLTKVMAALEEKKPASLKTLVLLVKNVERSITYRPDFVLFDIENRFVVGYGLDYKEYYRGLPGIYAFINDTPPKLL